MTEPNRPPSCNDDSEADAVSVAHARQAILDAIVPVDGEETLAIADALHRVLARPVHAPHDVPGHRNTAVDGYTLAGDELPQDGNSGSREFPVAATVLAGARDPGHCPPGACIRIMTGAPMPEGADTVVMLEHAEPSADGRVRIGDGHRKGQNVRQAGEDIAQGAEVFPAGQRLRPTELGILSSLGLAEIPCLRRPRIAVFSTGNEIREPAHGARLEPGELFDSNRYNLRGMLQRLDLEVLDLGILADDPRVLRTALRDAARRADAVITSGGVSMGEADHVKPVLRELGDLHFWKIAMKPGRPLSFGRIGQAAFFGLPGNPVAVVVTFYQFVQPVLEKLAGTPPTPPLLIPARCTRAIRKKPGRTEFIRAVFRSTPQGLEVRSLGSQGSGILTSMSRANGFIVLDEACDSVAAGDWVNVQPFQGLV